MDFVTLEYDREYRGWVPSHLDSVEECDEAMETFSEAAKVSKLRWEALDVLQRYCFKLVEVPLHDAVFGGDTSAPLKFPVEPKLGLRFLGVEARWGEYVAATQDQLVLGNPL